MSISDCHLCEKRRWRKCAMLCGVSGADIVIMQSRGCPIGKFGPGGKAMPPPEPIPDDYVPTPTNAIEGGCGCKK